MFFPKVLIKATAGHEGHFFTKITFLLQFNTGNGEEEKAAVGDAFDVVPGIAEGFEIVGDVEEVIVGLDALEGEKGEVKQGKTTEVEQYRPNAEACTGKATGHFGTVGKHSSKECPEKYEPKNGDEKFEKDGRVSADSLHSWCGLLKFLFVFFGHTCGN